jgi:hypothetical protein
VHSNHSHVKDCCSRPDANMARSQRDLRGWQEHQRGEGASRSPHRPGAREHPGPLQRDKYPRH